MSRHYHDSDCVAAAAENIADTLGTIAELLERIADAIAPTERQKENAAFARTSAAIVNDQKVVARESARRERVFGPDWGQER